MRKYIKSIREQYDNNSVIFKEAKRMFHYQPATNSNRLFSLSKGSKQSVTNDNHQFKEEFSSVKDIKNENNEVNESSWIAKLVNGIQQHSLQDLKVNNKDVVSKINEERKPLGEVNKNNNFKHQNVIIIDQQRQINSQSVSNYRPSRTEIQTKKNSYNFSKKSQTFTEKMSRTKNKNDKNDSFCDFGKNDQIKGKSAVVSRQKTKSLNRHISQSIITKTEASVKKEMGSKKKSLQNLNVPRRMIESKSKSSLNDDPFKASSLKSVEVVEKFQEKQQISKHIGGEMTHLNESLNEMQEIKCITEKKSHAPSLNQSKQKNQFLLEEYFAEPLFHDPLSQSEGSEKGQERTVKKTKFGSIRKNKGCIDSSKQDKPSYRQESTDAMVSPKFSSNSKITNYVITEKPVEQDEYISSQEQKILVDKYLRSDYSFKSYQVCQLENKISNNAFRKENKKYNYQIANSKQEGLSSHHINSQFSSLKDQPNLQCRSFHEPELQHRQVTHSDRKMEDRGYFERISSFKRESRCHPISSNYSSNRERVQTQQVLKNFVSPLLKHQKEPVLVKADSYISKQAYLQQSNESLMLELSGEKKQSSFQIGYVDKKCNSRPGVPSKYSYIANNSSLRQEHNSVRMRSGDKIKESLTIEKSDTLIDRLNSKLTSYINHHQLAVEQEPEQWVVGQPTHRAMHLSFNQLKKHRQSSRN